MAVTRAARNRRTQKTVPAKRGASQTYLALAKTYPIHPIRSPEDLDEAIAVLDGLLSRRKPLDEQEQDYLGSLAHEIERYEEEHVPVPDVSGADILRHLIGDRDLTLSDVAKATGIAVSTLSAVLNGKRNLNLTHIEKLARYFGVEPAVFLG
jgi:HTH-type transcriptional regulator/antitoxin HigA